MIDFDSLDYLQNGNERHRLAYQVLTNGSVFEKLSRFDPILVGTFPINIATEESDLDIICCWEDKDLFIKTLTDNFSRKQKFQIRKLKIRNIETVVVNFFIDPLPIEIFAQNRPVKEQEAYRHMITEHKILKERGERFRQEIIKLKKEGIKTEVAFAKLLGLDEKNAYDALLKFKFKV